MIKYFNGFTALKDIYFNIYKYCSSCYVSQQRALTSEDLIEEDLDVVGGERLRRHDHFVEVALHQLRYHVAAGKFAVKENKKLTHTRTDLRLHEHDASLSTGLVSVGFAEQVSINRQKERCHVVIIFTGGRRHICSDELDLDRRA